MNLNPRTVALVSRNYNDLSDYSQCLGEILSFCNTSGCDTVIFSPYSYETSQGYCVTHGILFHDFPVIENVILETGNFLKGNKLIKNTQRQTEVWNRNVSVPQIMHQHFAKSKEITKHLTAFQNAIPTRAIGTSFLLLCGELNIVCENDRYGFICQLNTLGIKVVINPAHDFMVRPEMNEKRRILSRTGRTVISVWNKGKHDKNGNPIRESRLPWKVFCGEQEKQVSSQLLQCNRDTRVIVGVFSL